MFFEHHACDLLQPWAPLQEGGASAGCSEPWLAGGELSVDPACADHEGMAGALRRATRFRDWRWPRREIHFIADPHADAGAFVASLVVGGGARRSGPGELDFELTPRGHRAVFVIGGDCLDKGPSNLQLLRAIRRLRDCRARVKLLAGNHDMRLLLALRCLEAPGNPLTEHLFVRMGEKGIPILQEVYREYVAGRERPLAGVPDAAECRRRLFPSEQWFDLFPRQASQLLSSAAIDKEVQRMRRKTAGFAQACARAGLGLREVYATARMCHSLFLEPGGEFAWFYRDMQLAYRAGSLLFLHAGMDDAVADLLARKGVRQLNRLYRRQVRGDLFNFYYGPLANCLRTKYREVDYPLTREGVDNFHRQGLHAIVHGHRNNHHGQRIVLRQGILHLECDTTLDRNSRALEGLAGIGAGVTVIRPGSGILGISNDYPRAKVFEPALYLTRREAPCYETEPQEFSPRVAAGC